MIARPFLFLWFALPLLAGERSLVTDEPQTPKGKPEGAAAFEPAPPPEAGRHLAATLRKLEGGLDRPLLVWAIGSSYTNMLGNGEFWREQIPGRFPNAPPIEYKKMVGNSCPWQYLRGWVRHLVEPDQPDLVITYTIGNPDDLEKLIIELRQRTTADIIVPSIHWRERDQDLWGKSENAADQDVARVREICRKHQVEFIENRRAWAEYLQANQLTIPDLLKDAVHQSDYGAFIINSNILSHLRRPDHFSYDPASRERRVQPEHRNDGSLSLVFIGTRVDLTARKTPDGGRYRVLIDGLPADEVAAFLPTYIQPGSKNAREGRGANPRDQSPHGVTLGANLVPQDWTLVMTSDAGDYELTGSLTGPDGTGNAFKPFISTSGQIIIEPELWRRAERNRTGDRFTFSIQRATVSELDFAGPAGETFTLRLAQALPNREHTLTLVPLKDGAAPITHFDVFQPPYGP